MQKINENKESIINQAIKFHTEGNISEAVKYYELCINKNYNDHRVFSNYGIILKNQKQLKKAAFSIRKAIKILPNYAIYHFNLGNVMTDLGKLLESV